MFKIFNLILILVFFASCESFNPKKVDTRKTPVNAQERARKNIEEGRAIKFSKLGKGGGSGNFEFANSA